MTAFSIHAYNFKLKKAAFTFILAIMMIPTQVTALGFINMLRRIKLMDSFIPLIVPAIAAPAKPEAIEPAVEHVLAAATTVPKAVAEEKMVTMSERDIPITRPENYKYTPEELAQLKKQAAEAYLKWVELELEISKNNLQQTAQN